MSGEAAPPVLAPCPFCGGTGAALALDKVLRDGYDKHPDDPDAYAYSIRCLSCAATGGWAKQASGAVRWWNMRVEATAPPG